MLKRYIVGFVLLALAEIGFGLTFVIGSVLTKRCGVSAEVLAFGRFAIAGLVLLGILAATAGGRAALRRPCRRDWLTMAWLGPVGTSVMAWCVFIGCSRVSVANAAMADALTPLMIFVASAALTRRLSGGEFVGVCCGFVGALLVIQVLCRDGFVLEAYTLGDAFILLAAATWAVYTVFGTRTIRRIGSAVFTAWTMLIGAALVGAVLPFVPAAWPQDVRAWLLLAALALVSTLMPFWAWNAAQRYLPVSVISVSAYFAPVVAMALGVLLIGETVTGLQWLGTLFIIASATAETGRARSMSKWRGHAGRVTVPGEGQKTADKGQRRMAGGRRAADRRAAGRRTEDGGQRTEAAEDRRRRTEAQTAKRPNAQTSKLQNAQTSKLISRGNHHMNKITVFVFCFCSAVCLASARAAVPDCDVCVVGGGVAGVAAALQAGRAGARTVLVEQAAMVGGNMTSGGVTWPGLFHAWGRQVIAGCGWDLVTNCVALAGGRLPDFSQDPGRRHWRHQVRINAPLWVALAEEALTKAGVEIRYHAAPQSALFRDDGWDLTLSSIGETASLRARVLIDATGNGTLTALCGAKRLRDPSACQPGSFTYLINPCADESRLDWAALEKAAAQAVKDGRLDRTDIARGVRFLVRESNVVLNGFAQGPDHGTTIANYVAGADNSTAELRTRTNLRGRAAMLRVFRFLKSQPGLERATLVEMSSEVGVRETYRVEGDYVLTGDDYVTGRVFGDSVCFAFYPIDVHTVEGGVHPKHLKRGTVATVPLRALVAKGARNLLVAGRCVSADRAANSALRVQATCMATGQAAGEAAALAARGRCDVRQVSVDELRTRLRESGAIVP